MPLKITLSEYVIHYYFPNLLLHIQLIEQISDSVEVLAFHFRTYNYLSTRV